MSYAAERWARAQTVGDARAKQVLIELAHCMNSRTGLCNPGREYLHVVTELKLSTISAATTRLEQLGFIRKIGSKGVSLRYEFPKFDPEEWKESKAETGLGTESYSVQNRTRGEAETVPTTKAETVPRVGPKPAHKQGINREEEQRTEQEVMCAPSGNSSANAAVASAQAQTPYPEDFDQSLFDEAMLATQDSEQAPEALPDPDADLPPKKQRRSQQPRVPFPETLPDDWAEAAKIARPDIDPQRVFLKLRARYAPTTTKKTLATWKREFMNWIGKEFAYDNRYRSSAQKPQRTLGATDTRSLNHRNFGKWASHAV